MKCMDCSQWSFGQCHDNNKQPIGEFLRWAVCVLIPVESDVSHIGINDSTQLLVCLFFFYIGFDKRHINYKKDSVF